MSKSVVSNFWWSHYLGASLWFAADFICIFGRSHVLKLLCLFFKPRSFWWMEG